MAFLIDEAYLPATLTVPPMSDQQFAQFCPEHPDLFFEMTAEGGFWSGLGETAKPRYNASKMTHELNATYEQGAVLRLSHPLPLADHQHVQVIVSDNQQPTGSGRWAAIDLRTGEILLYADTVKKARDQGRALDRGEPLIHWVSGDSELPSAGL